MAYTSTAALRQYLGIAETGDDALLSDFIAAAQVVLDDLTGYTFEASANTIRYFDAITDVDGRTLNLDRPLVSINSITNGDATVVASSSYVTEPRNDTPWFALKLKDNANVEWTYDDTPENAIAVSGKWATV